MIIRMLGLRPDGGVGAGCACATLTDAIPASADAAASVVPPSRMLRRLGVSSFVLVLVSSRSFFVPITCSLFERQTEVRHGWLTIYRFGITLTGVSAIESSNATPAGVICRPAQCCERQPCAAS